MKEWASSKGAGIGFDSGRLDVPNQAFSPRSQFGFKTMLSTVPCRQKVIESLDVFQRRVAIVSGCQQMTANGATPTIQS